MSATATTTEGQPAGAPTSDSKGGAVELLKSLQGVPDTINALKEEVTGLKADLAEATKPRRGEFTGRFTKGIRPGEDPLTSRPYSLMKLANALSHMRDPSAFTEAKDRCKVEFELSSRLRKAYRDSFGPDAMSDNLTYAPLGADLMPIDDRYDEEGNLVKGFPSELVRECREVMRCNELFDEGELDHALAKAGMPLRKDLSGNTATTGSSLIGYASQGELIELLRAQEVFSQVGAQEIDLPPQGSIRFPRSTGTVTIVATTEGATFSESTPTFGELILRAKPYTGLVDIPDELMRFSTSVAVEAWLRTEFTRELSLKATRDMIDGGGGKAIQGIINYSGVRTVIASSTGGSGDTLDPEDLARLYADIADQNAPVDTGFFYAMTNTLWAGFKTRKASTSGEFMFSMTTSAMGNLSMTRPAFDGHPVIGSTQVPTDRVKTATNLTLVLAGVPREYLIARSGVVAIDMTNSDASKFAQRLNTLRGTQYIDAGPRHEESFGMIDDLVNG